MAQGIALTYTTELQTDFRRETNWVNLLRADFSLPLTSVLGLEASTISVAKTHKESLLDNLQTFSNIEEENIPLAPVLLGVSGQTKRASFFVGVRNLNEDYFTSPCTALFTNSSCGIFPTLSANYPIANYPVASVGADVKWSITREWLLETSLYNGTGYRRFCGRENVFRFCPRSDGVLSVTSINYQHHDSNYFIGVALHHGVPVDDEAGDETTQIAAPSPPKETNAVVWGYVEQRLVARTYVLLQASATPSAQSGCRRYVGAGIVVNGTKATAGAFTNYADFTSEREWASELTCYIPCLGKGYIQPTLHLICNSRARGVIGLLRMGYQW